VWGLGVFATTTSGRSFLATRTARTRITGIVSKKPSATEAFQTLRTMPAVPTRWTSLSDVTSSPRWGGIHPTNSRKEGMTKNDTE
jgi:hypothetical protein